MHSGEVNSYTAEILADTQQKSIQFASTVGNFLMFNPFIQFICILQVKKSPLKVRFHLVLQSSVENIIVQQRTPSRHFILGEFFYLLQMRVGQSQTKNINYSNSDEKKWFSVYFSFLGI